MHAKSSFAHQLQSAKMASANISAQNNGPGVQNSGSWMWSVSLERKIFYTRTDSVRNVVGVRHQAVT